MKRLLPLALCLGLTGCASSYVVLLPNSDGTVGKVQVTGPNGTTQLDQALQGTKMGAASGETFVATPAQIQSDFAGAMAARPQPPKRFVLYFEAGGTTLTAESERALASVQQEIGSRKVPDISITGHTDTDGDDAQNLKLGLERAQQVQALLVSPQLTADKVTVESHGEKNMLVPTADNVAEPRNRRVEISVR